MLTVAELAKEIAASRKHVGLTQRELALAIGSGERFIVELEAGKPTVRLGMALAAAHAVGLGIVIAGRVKRQPE
jgi:HTH-type transcriptional regulator / antitoxin HipB